MKLRNAIKLYAGKLNELLGKPLTECSQSMAILNMLKRSWKSSQKLLEISIAILFSSHI
jgi:hypothetical protein